MLMSEHTRHSHCFPVCIKWYKLVHVRAPGFRALVISHDGAAEGTPITKPDVLVRFRIAGHGRLAHAVAGCHGPSKAGASACLANGK